MKQLAEPPLRPFPALQQIRKHRKQSCAFSTASSPANWPEASCPTATAVAAHRKGAEGAGSSGRTERRERPSGPSSPNFALRNGHFVHQNDGSKIGKSARSFLDPIFYVETDYSLQFGVRAHPGGHFWIAKFQLHGGSTYESAPGAC